MDLLPLIVDGILILIAVSSIFDGRRKGFVKTFLSLVATAISILIAHEYSAPLAEWANEAFVHNAAVNTFSEAITAQLGNGTQALIESIPDFIVEAAEAGGISVSGVVSDIGSSIDATQAAEKIYGGIYGIIVFPVLSVIAFLVIYAIGNAVLSLGISVINGIFRLPVLKSLNRFLGGIVGAVKGIVVVAILSVVLVSVAGIISPETLGAAVEAATLPNIFADLILG